MKNSILKNFVRIIYSTPNERNMMCSNNLNDHKQSCFSTLSLPSLGEMEQTVCMLERGTIITKYYPRRRPEQKTLMLRRETRQVHVFWSYVDHYILELCFFFSIPPLIF